MKGRKPRPTHLKVIEGNPGRRPLNVDEPIAPGNLEDPPAWMTETQRQGWAYAVEHAPAGVLKRIDRSVLAIWVVAEDLHREASEKVQKFGMLTKVGANEKGEGGTVQQSPYLPVLNKQAQIMLKAAAELGFTPSSRSRISVKDDGEAKTNRFRGHGTRA